MKGLAKNCEGAFVGLAQTVYLTVYIYTVLLQGFSEIYGVYIRFQPTLRIAFAQVYDTRTETYITFEEAMQQVQELENQQGVAA
jgi:hypothetical protein